MTYRKTSKNLGKQRFPAWKKGSRLSSRTLIPLWWSCGELNPGPMTVPSVFYVRSLLAKMAIFLPPTLSQTTVGEHILS